MEDLEIEDLNSPSSGGNKPNKGNKKIFLIISIICLIVAAFAIFYIVRYYVVLNKGEDVYESLQESMTLSSEEPTQASTEPVPSTTESEESPEDEIMARKIDFAGLQADTNKDIYAWISIPDTNIDYPMVQHPTDDTYYLNYNLDGTKGYPGCIYTERENDKDFSDYNTIIYGHNMKNGTMFHDLHSYSDAQFMEEHPYVYVYLEGRTLKYQIFAAYKYDDRHLLYSFSYDTEYQRTKYIEEVFGQRNMAAVYDEDVEVDSESHIITMSTCIGGQASNRFLVQAVLIDDINES